jgi:hypothetical protein
MRVRKDFWYEWGVVVTYAPSFVLEMKVGIEMMYS